MAWTDETLMAFADGELDSSARAEIEAALAADAGLRVRVDALRAQRARVAAAFAPVLDEPMPARLSALLEPAAAPSIDLRAARAERARRRASLSWAQWGGIAAAVLVGVFGGMRLERRGADPLLALHGGRLVAVGVLDAALTTQLASTPSAHSPIAVQLSFLDRTGNYCRTFSAPTLAGLACRQGDQWAVQNVGDAAAPPSSGMRQAASALPRTVRDAVDARQSGDMLDAIGERAARDRGWKR